MQQLIDTRQDVRHLERERDPILHSELLGIQRHYRVGGPRPRSLAAVAPGDLSRLPREARPNARRRAGEE